MLNPCEKCPNRAECLTPVTLVPGAAAVAFTVEGTYYYWANVSIDHLESARGQVNDPDNKYFPELAASIDACQAPILNEIQTPTRSLLGRLGFETRAMAIDGICPGLAEHFDLRTAKAVIKYFSRPLP